MYLENCKTYTTTIKIEKVKDWGNSLSVLAENRWYKYWKKPDRKELEERIQEGKELKIYVNEVKKNNIVYYNFIPDIFAII